MRRLLSVVIAMIVAACSSETTGTGDAAPCADISGNYTVRGEFISGSCDPTLVDPEASATITKPGDGPWTVRMPGLPGGCPGTLDSASCKFHSDCEIVAKDGGLLGTLALDYTFTASGYTGTVVAGLHPPLVQSVCDLTYRETAQKL